MKPKDNILPLLPIKEMVLFPHMKHPFVVGRPRSIAAVEKALLSEEKTLIVVTQRDSSIENPQREELYSIGTRALVRKMERLPNDSIGLSLRGLDRVKISNIDFGKEYLEASFSVVPLPTDESDEIEALHRQVLEQATQLDELMSDRWFKGILPQMLQSVDEPLDHVFLLCSVLNLDVKQQQDIHETDSRLQALKLVHEYLNHEILILGMQQDIAMQAAANVTKEQKEYMLRRQLEEIQKELGEKTPEQGEIELLRSKLDETELPEPAKKIATKELQRLERLPAAAQDYQLTYAYLELLLELPWKKSTKHKLDLIEARRILDADHFDLEKIKDRIIEHLAIYKLNPKTRGAMLCFVGGPGVGKTSLGASIAKALGREFDRISLGGLHDESELRGHRRTYIGAMPGRIIQALHRTGVNNPLIMLDEVDKLGQDYRGDPAAALMEILDPAQNDSFHDNYLDLDFDLSKVFFVATANTLETIPRPLLDRMEIIRLSGYTEEEKVEIAKRYLVPRQIKDVNLPIEKINIPDAVIQEVVRRYTREAGVRELERQIAAIVRNKAVEFAEGRTQPVTIQLDQLTDILGTERFALEKARESLSPGVSTGLAWTEAGGDVLFIESVLIPNEKGLNLTGQLGEVMKESAQAALSYIRSRSRELGVPAETFSDAGFHIHVPAGAIPKDGPSAGVTIATSLISLVTGERVRKDTAMTGEITLSGLVLPVGGIKEKVLAARRAGLLRIVLPKANSKDLDELKDEIRQEIEFILVEHLDEVFAAAIDKE